jgi:hypothetical protein
MPTENVLFWQSYVDDKIVSDSYMIHLSRRECPSARAWSRNISNYSHSRAFESVAGGVGDGRAPRLKLEFVDVDDGLRHSSPPGCE